MPKIEIEYGDIGFEQSIANLRKLREEKNRLNQSLAQTVSLRVNTRKAQDDLDETAAKAKEIEKRFTDIATAAKRLGTTPQGLKTLSRELGLTVKQAVDASAVIRKLTLANASLDQQYIALNKTLGLNRRQVEGLVQAAGSQVTSLEKASRQLGLSIGEAQRFAQSLGLTERQIGLAVETLRRLDRTTSDSDERFSVLNRTLGLSKSQFDAIEGSIQEFDKTFQQANAQAGDMAAALDFANDVLANARSVFQSSTQTYVEFANGIKQAGVISGASQDEIQALREEAERLGVVTSKSPAEVGQMTVALSRAGFTAVESTAAIEGIARASEATGASLENVGDVLSKTIRIFGLEADASQEIADILVATVNNTNTSIESIRESLSNVGPTAAATNQGLADTAIAIGLLGDAGIQGGEAGTALESVLLAIRNAAAQSADEIDGIGAEADILRRLADEAQNAEGGVRPLFEILEILNEELSDITNPTERASIIQSLFGDVGARGANVLLNTAAERVGAVSDAVREAEGISNASGEAMLEGLGGAFDLIGGSLDSVQIKIGDFVSGPLEALIRTANDVLVTFLQLPAPIQKVLLGVAGLGAVIAGAVVATTAWEASNVRAVIALLATNAQTLRSSIFTQADTVAKNVNVAATKASALNNLTLSQVYTALATRVAASTKSLTLKTAALKANARQVLTQIGALRGLAAQAFVLVGAYVAIRDILQTLNSEQAQQARELRAATDEFLEARDAAQALREGLEGVSEDGEETASILNRLTDSINRALEAAGERGVLEGTRNLMLDIQSVLLGTADASDRLGASLFRIGEFEFGLATQEQIDSQRLTIALNESIQRLGGSYQDVIDILNEYGQAIGGAEEELSPELVKEYTERLADKAAAIQEEIDFLETQKTGSEELDAQIANEIAQRENLIRIIRDKVALANGEVDAIDDQINAVKELTEFLEELKAAEEEALAQTNLSIAQQRRDLAKDIAQGNLTDAQADLREAQITQDEAAATAEAIQARLDGLETRLAATQDESERENLNQEIVAAQTDLANAEAAIYEGRADQAEKSLKEAEDAEKERLEALEATFEEQQNLLDQAQKDRELQTANLELSLLREGVDEEEISDRVREDTLAAERDSIQEQIALLEEKKAAFADNADAQAEIALELADLEIAATENAIESEIAARERAERARERAIREFEAQTEQQKAALQGVADEYDIQAQAIDLINASLERQSNLLQGQINLLQARAGLQEAIATGEISDLERALQIRRQLDDDQEESAEQRRALEQELSDLGVSRRADEADILEDIIEAEQRRSRDRISALQNEQNLASISQEIEARNNILAAQRAVTQARINELKAQQNALDAEAAFFAAQQTGDRQQIDLAARGLEASRRGVELAALEVAQSEEALVTTQQQIDQLERLNDLEAARAELQLLQNERANAQSRLNDAIAEGDSGAIRAARSYFRELDEGYDQARARAEELQSSVELDPGIGSAEALAGLGSTNLDLTRNQADEEERAALAAQDRVAAYRELEGLQNRVNPSSGSPGSQGIPQRKTGGPVVPGQLYQVHSNELIVPNAPGYVLNQFDSRAVRRMAMEQARQMLVSAYLPNPKAVVASAPLDRDFSRLEGQVQQLNRTTQKLLDTVKHQPPPSLTVRNQIEKSADLGDLYAQQLSLLRARNRMAMRGRG